jgi:hypothetical protein
MFGCSIHRMWGQILEGSGELPSVPIHVIRCRLRAFSQGKKAGGTSSEPTLQTSRPLRLQPFHSQTKHVYKHWKGQMIPSRFSIPAGWLTRRDFGCRHLLHTADPGIWLIWATTNVPLAASRHQLRRHLWGNINLLMIQVVRLHPPPVSSSPTWI